MKDIPTPTPVLDQSSDGIEPAKQGIDRSWGIVAAVALLTAGHLGLALFDLPFLHKAVFLGFTILSPGYLGIALLMAKKASLGPDRVDPMVVFFIVASIVCAAYTVVVLHDNLQVFTDLVVEGTFVALFTLALNVVNALVAGRDKDPQA